MVKAKKKSNTLFPVLILFYLFFVIGFLFHTSAHPVFFEKYTIKYFVTLCFLIFFSPLIFLIFKKLAAKISKKTFIIFIISILIIILSTTEVFLRIKFKNYESSNYTATVDNFDPFLQGKLTATDNLRDPGLHINSLGFRGKEIQKEKAENTFRIVILGGSTVLNREVTFEKNAARLLEKQLQSNFPDKKIEVINAGKDGYTSEHSLIQYMFKIKDFDPDLVIMWHGVNDMWASCTTEGLTRGKYKTDYSHLLGPTAYIVFNYFHPQPLIQVKLLTLDFLLKALHDNFYSDFTNKLEEYFRVKRAEDYLKGKNTITVHDFPSISAYERNLLYLIQLTKESNTPLILGNQANMYIKNPTVNDIRKIIYPALVCQKNNKYYNLDSLRYGINQFNILTKKIAEENGVFFVDINSLVPKNFNYFTDAVHYTEKGDEIISSALFKKITEENLIK